VEGGLSETLQRENDFSGFTYVAQSALEVAQAASDSAERLV